MIDEKKLLNDIVTGMAERSLFQAETLKQVMYLIHKQPQIGGGNITPEIIEEYMKFEDECVQKGFSFNSLLEAREKQIPKKPNRKVQAGDLHIGRIVFKDGTKTYWCPNCNNAITGSDKYCRWCGQAIDWNWKE